MKNLRIKFLLSLYIILLGGYGQLYAHAENNAGADSLVTDNVKLTSQNDTLDDDVYCDYLATPTTVFSCIDRQDIKVYISDNEVNEENLIPFAKTANFAHYPSSVYVLPAYYCQYTKKCLVFDRHLFYLPNYRRYLMFRVFRI